MEQVVLFIGILLLVALLTPLAGRLGVAYPIVLVIGGIIPGLLPFVPEVKLEPEVVFFLILPPLLYWDAVSTSWRDFVHNLNMIRTLAISLVLITCGVVAAATHFFLGLPWSAGFVLGAIVASTDAVTTGAIANKVGLPRRIVATLEGESLVNDASALVLYGAAVSAVVTGHFSLQTSAFNFLYVPAVGILIGLAIGWLVARVRRPVHDVQTAGVIELLTPFLAYLPAEMLGASGVLAAVAAGIYLGRRSPVEQSAATRLQTGAVWDFGSFVINGFVFVLIGLEIQPVLEAVDGLPFLELLGAGLLVSGVVIGVRMLWMLLAGQFSAVNRYRQPRLNNRQLVVMGWSGMRGVVTLATAFALPETTDSGPFPARSIIVFLAFCVIMVTLIGQGLSLPWLIRWLGVADSSEEEHEESLARNAMAEAVVERVETMANDGTISAKAAHVLHGYYERRIVRPHASVHPELGEWSQTLHAVRADLLNTERSALVNLRDHGEISDEVLRRIQLELDLTESRLERDTDWPGMERFLQIRGTVRPDRGQDADGHGENGDGEGGRVRAAQPRKHEPDAIRSYRWERKINRAAATSNAPRETVTAPDSDES